MSDRDESGGSWTLLTGHGHVLVEITRNPVSRIRDIAAAVDLTERTVQAIVADRNLSTCMRHHLVGLTEGRLLPPGEG